MLADLLSGHSDPTDSFLFLIMIFQHIHRHAEKKQNLFFKNCKIIQKDIISEKLISMLLY